MTRKHLGCWILPCFLVYFITNWSGSIVHCYCCCCCTTTSSSNNETTDKSKGKLGFDFLIDDQIDDWAKFLDLHQNTHLMRDRLKTIQDQVQSRLDSFNQAMVDQNHDLMDTNTHEFWKEQKRLMREMDEIQHGNEQYVKYQEYHHQLQSAFNMVVLRMIHDLIQTQLFVLNDNFLIQKQWKPSSIWNYLEQIPSKNRDDLKQKHLIYDQIIQEAKQQTITFYYDECTNKINNDGSIPAEESSHLKMIIDIAKDIYDDHGLIFSRSNTFLGTITLNPATQVSFDDDSQDMNEWENDERNESEIRLKIIRTQFQLFQRLMDHYYYYYHCHQSSDHSDDSGGGDGSSHIKEYDQKLESLEMSIRDYCIDQYTREMDTQGNQTENDEIEEKVKSLLNQVFEVFPLIFNNFWSVVLGMELMKYRSFFAFNVFNQAYFVNHNNNNNNNNDESFIINDHRMRLLFGLLPMEFGQSLKINPLDQCDLNYSGIHHQISLVTLNHLLQGFKEWAKQFIVKSDDNNPAKQEESSLSLTKEQMHMIHLFEILLMFSPITL